VARICRANLTALVLLAAAMPMGCGRQNQVNSYRVPKPEVLARRIGAPVVARPAARLEAAPERVLAAIMPLNDQTWFFRFGGPPKAMAQQVDAFDSLVKSVRFSGDPAKPRWTLPAGWREEPGAGMRFATLRVAGPAPGLELSVIRLPRGDKSEAAHVLDNVNRWRGQLSLPPITAEQLPDQTQTIDVSGVKTTLVDLVGTRKADGMAQPPFAGGTFPRAVAPAVAPPEEELTYDLPSGWVVGEASGLRKVSLGVEHGDQRAEITVIDLGGVAGDKLANVNRWRQQINLEETTADKLAAEVKQLPLGKQTADYVELIGDKKSILAAMLARGDQVWFFKMMGDTELVRRERERFESFVRSVRFPGG
jgi:hypothetical protein